MKRRVKLILAVNLLALAVLAFVYPHLMVGPGRLIPGHAKLEQDCFACHAPMHGAVAQRCVTCHKAEEIGRLTTAGTTIEKPLTSVPFHQQLTKEDCLACHSDHSGVRRFRLQGQFNHGLLQPAASEKCQVCHKSPTDSLHQQISGNCQQCHTVEKWTPATFAHDKLFRLDRDHNVRCAICHEANDYQRFTCYGCHEHTLENVRREHIEEGIRNFRNCVECHRSADEHEIAGRYRNGFGRGGEDD